MQHRRVHRGHSLEDRHPVALDDLQGLVRVEAGKQGETAAGEDARVEPARLPEGVKQRQGTEQDVISRGLGQAPGHLGVGGEVVVGQLGALGLTCRPRGVEDDCGLGAVDVHHLLHRVLVAQQLLELSRGDRYELGPGLLGAPLGRLGEVVPGEQQLALGIAEVEGHLAPLEQDVHRDNHPARAEHAVVGQGEIGDVGQHDPHPVAALDPAVCQQSGDAARSLLERFVGDLGVVELQGNVLGVAGGAVREVCRQVAAHRSTPGSGSRRSGRTAR